MSEEAKCAIALNISLGLSKDECQSVEEFVYYAGTLLYGLSPNEIPNKKTCRLTLMRSLSKRNYKQILVYVLCVLMRELEAGKNFNEAIALAWIEAKGKIGE